MNTLDRSEESCDSCLSGHAAANNESTTTATTSMMMSCASMDCPSHYLPKEGADQGSSIDACCDRACSLFDCPAGQAQLNSADTVPGASESLCCRPSCSRYSCPSGLQVKMDADRIVGSTAEECCDGLFTCTPYTNRSGHDVSKVVLMQETSQKRCVDQGLQQEAMATYCNDFCSTGGSLQGLPLQLGSSEYGFNLGEMNGICEAIADANRSLLNFCRQRSNALLEIQVKAAEFVAKVQEFKAKQVVFRGSMQNASQQLQSHLASQAFATEIGDSVEKLVLLKRQFQGWATGVTSGPDFQSLQGSMDALTTSAILLDDVVRRNLRLFEEYITECNGLLLGMGSAQEYLLDVCPQLNGACIEREAGNGRNLGPKMLSLFLCQCAR